MKKNLYSITVLFVALFLGVSVANAATLHIDSSNNYGCTYNMDENTETCNVKLVVQDGSLTKNRIKIGYNLVKLTPNVSKSLSSNGWHLIEMTDTYFIVESEVTVTPGTYEIATLVFNTGGVGCRLDFNGIYPFSYSYVCQQKYGLYYDKYGNNVTYADYLVSCFGCKAKGVIDNNYHGTTGAVVSEADYYRQCGPARCKKGIDSSGNTIYFGLSGTEVTATQYAVDCEGKKICDDSEKANGIYYGTDGNKTDILTFYRTCGNLKCDEVSDDTTTIYFDKTGTEVTELEYTKQCKNTLCKEFSINNTKYYFNKSGSEVTKSEYQKECLTCEKDENNNKYYNKDGEEVSKYQHELICGELRCQILTNDEGKTVYYDKDGNETTELVHIKQCSVHTCEILSDGTRYNKDGKEVNEDEYLKSCYNCRREDDKYYDENGKETTEETWKAMCEPHKCQVIGDKYFNDKGKIVTKDEYDKACTNPKTGMTETAKMYFYIFLGFTLTGVMLFVSRKFSKIRRV